MIIGDILPEVFPLDLLMSKGIVILLEGCEEQIYRSARPSAQAFFPEHLAEHLRLPHDNNLSAAMLTGTIAAFLSIAKSNKSLEERKQDLYDYIVTLAFLVFQTLQIPDLIFYSTDFKALTISIRFSFLDTSQTTKSEIAKIPIPLNI